MSSKVSSNGVYYHAGAENGHGISSVDLGLVKAHAEKHKCAVYKVKWERTETREKILDFSDKH